MKTSPFEHLLLCCILLLSSNLYSQTSGKVIPAIDYNPIWFNNGRAGIGISNPAEKLHLDGNFLNTGNIYSNGDDGFIAIDDNAPRLGIVKKSGNRPYFAASSGTPFRFMTTTSSTISNVSGRTFTELMRLTPEGYLGLGTLNPTEKLDVNGTIKGRNLSLEPTSGGIKIKPTNKQWDHYFLVQNSADPERLFAISTGGGGINSTSWFPTFTGRVNTNHPAMNITGVQMDSTNNYPIIVLDARKNGETALNQPLVGIANGYGKFKVKFLADGAITSVGGAQFEKDVIVNATIKANEIRVEANGHTADFVFENGYNLRPLEEVESFILENKHLPEIPNAAQMEAEGTNLAEMNKLLLMKIEELTLYMIDQQKMINELKGAISKE